MLIRFKSSSLKKVFNQGRQLEIKYGSARAHNIRLRMSQLNAAESLMDFWPPKTPPERCHELTGGQRGKQYQLSVDIDRMYRLVFVPDHNPIPIRPQQGGLDWAQVTKILIVNVEDTHG